MLLQRIQVKTGYFRLLQVTTCFYRLLQAITGYYRVLQVTTGYYRLYKHYHNHNHLPEVHRRRIPCLKYCSLYNCGHLLVQVLNCLVTALHLLAFSWVSWLSPLTSTSSRLSSTANGAISESWETGQENLKNPASLTCTLPC